MQINVLISTYNGEKYICEQINSIWKQTYKNIKIYIRDDGSTDETLKRIKECDIENKIELIEGRHIGFGRSFGELLRISEEGDLWAFCDQDDLWLPQKIEWAVEWFRNTREEKPALFHTAFEIRSAQMDVCEGLYLPPSYRVDFRRCLTDCVFQGFSIVINRSLREKMLMCNTTKSWCHDWMAMLIAVSFGVTEFDERIGAWHRRMLTSASSMKFRKRVKWFLSMFFQESNTKSTLCEFERVFGNKLGDKEQRLLSYFTHDKYSLKDSIKKAVYPGRWRPLLSSEIAVRILMLLGKI